MVPGARAVLTSLDAILHRISTVQDFHREYAIIHRRYLEGVFMRFMHKIQNNCSSPVLPVDKIVYIM